MFTIGIFLAAIIIGSVRQRRLTMAVRITNETLRFLKNLKQHNDRGWFSENKEKYNVARENFVVFVQSLLDEVSKFDDSVAGLEAESAVFRIYRDIRFSKDKSPYKTHFAASLKGKGNDCGRAGYYVHLEPAGSFLAGGVHMIEPRDMAEIRQEISTSGKEFLKIINDKKFRKNFVLEGDTLARVPHGFDEADPMAEYLKYKDLTIIHSLSDNEILSADSVPLCAGIFKAMVPFNAFVNRSATTAEKVPSKYVLPAEGASFPRESLQAWARER
jgi:uncharacterized protein (TIGR02453 family)